MSDLIRGKIVGIERRALIRAGDGKHFGRCTRLVEAVGVDHLAVGEGAVADQGSRLEQIVRSCTQDPSGHESSSTDVVSCDFWC